MLMNESLNADEALSWVNQRLRAKKLPEFSDLKCQVFLGCWNGDTYPKIAEQSYREQGYVREIGASLWKQLSQICEEPVLKNNLRTVIQRRIQEADREAQDVRTFYPTDALKLTELNHGLHEDPTFLGRDEDIAAIDRKWKQDRASVILIHGAGGMGKTRLAWKYLESRQFGMLLECWMPSESLHVPSAESQVGKWLKQHFNEEVGREFHVNLDRLRYCLRQASVPVAILIDNFDVILDGRGRLHHESRAYLDLLRMLAETGSNGSKILTLITSREILQEGRVNLTLHSLQGLSEVAWKKAFSHHEIDIHTTRSTQALQEMWDACQGNATAMHILMGEVRDRYESDLVSYWHECDRNLLNDCKLQELVASQFDKLQQQYPPAYKLLCRLGCYRYQAPSHISGLGVRTLLWDVPESDHRGVIRSLENLALIESRRGNIFWLHPMIHAEARKRLRFMTDWGVAHSKASEFWLQGPTRVQKLEDTRPFLEAYYHALDREDYDQACEVLCTPVPSLWGESLSLGWVLYRFRSLQQIIDTAQPILSKAEPGLDLGRLCNLLGYTYRATGDLDRALTYHRQALTIAEDQSLKHLQISSLMNLGLSHRDRWDIDAAIDEFQEVYDLSRDDPSTGYQRYSACCLAYLYSGWGDKAMALDYLHAVDTYELSPTGSNWGQAYSLLYLGHAYRNLGDYEAALELFQEVLIASQTADFIPIYAMALSASAQIYREFKQMNEAIDRHDSAIELLDKLGAKCDLAGAYAQRGLTYQALGEENKAWQDKGMAIGLFRAINVPKQVAWVEEVFRQKRSSG
jgi:tetratricopeptide (TPR) repeat protein